MDSRPWLLMFALAATACGAKLREVPPSLDPSNPAGPEGAAAPPQTELSQPKPAATNEMPMPGDMGHDMPMGDMPMGHAMPMGDMPMGHAMPMGNMPMGQPHAAPHGHSPPSPPAKAPKPIYQCPMHPEVIRNQPGRCPKCGMQLQLQKAQGAP